METELTPQDKAINHSLPIQAWEIYEYENEIYAHAQDWIPWYKLKDAYAVVYEFRGKTAHIVCCSQDASITRDVALGWATLLVAGRLRTITIDLTACSPSERKK